MILKVLSKMIDHHFLQSPGPKNTIQMEVERSSKTGHLLIPLGQRWIFAKGQGLLAVKFSRLESNGFFREKSVL